MKRHLKKWVEITLIFITMFLMLLTVGINDFSLSALPILIIDISIIALNINILDKYGTGMFIEKDGENE